jgi:hypothetical protein
VIIQDDHRSPIHRSRKSRFLSRGPLSWSPTRYNLPMRFATVLVIFLLVTGAFAQNAPSPAPRPEPKSVTVPITFDHNRVIVDADLRLPDGSAKRIRAWVDNGNPDLGMSHRLATLMGLTVTCDDKTCSAPPPGDITIGGMKIPLTAVKEANIPLPSGTSAAVMIPGMAAEINIPSSILRKYDVLINFPNHELTIAQPGSLKFNGVKTKVIMNPENGLIQIPSQIENKKYNLALDLAEPISFLSVDLFDRLSAAHPDWPHMIGAIGPANVQGADDELTWNLIRLDRLQYGPLFLTDVAVVALPKDKMTAFEKRAGVSTVGLLGSEAMLDYRVGLDYAHSAVYFDIGRTFKFPDFDVIGLILRPEDDGRFTILGIADFDGKPSVPEGEEGIRPGDHLLAVDGIPVPGSSMGQVWSLLGGSPGKERTLTIERAGKQFLVVAAVQHFLGVAEESTRSKEKRQRN